MGADRRPEELTSLGGIKTKEISTDRREAESREIPAVSETERTARQLIRNTSKGR